VQLRSYYPKLVRVRVFTYAPYFSIIQSGGYGKTALALDIAKEMKSHYICLRDMDITGTPGRIRYPSLILLVRAGGNITYRDGISNFRKLFKMLKRKDSKFDTADELIKAQNIMKSSINNRDFGKIFLKRSVLLYRINRRFIIPPSHSYNCVNY
jgi:hypothetical protein